MIVNQTKIQRSRLAEGPQRLFAHERGIGAMKKAIFILAGLLFVGFATKLMSEEPLTAEQKKQRVTENQKVKDAISKLGGTLYPECSWVDGFYVIFEKDKLTDGGLERLKAFPQIKGLDLSGSQVTDAGCKHLKVFTKLRRLELNGTKITDAGLENISGLAELEKLFLNDTKITDAGLRHIVKLRLKSLDVRGTQVSNAGLADLRNMQTLEGLELSQTKVTDAGLAHLAGLARLESLCLAGTKTGNEGLKHLAGLAELADLDLKSDSGFSQRPGTHRQAREVVSPGA